MSSIDMSNRIVVRPASRTDIAAGNPSASQPDSAQFRQALNQPEAKARRGTGTSESTDYNADDTTRALVRLDNNSVTRLNQSEFSNGRGSTIQPAGRLPTPPALFATGSTQDTGATRDQILSRRVASPEIASTNEVGAFVDSTTASTARTANSIESGEAEFLLSQQNIQPALPTSERYAAASGVARNGSGEPEGSRAATAIDPGYVAPQVGQQLVRQYQQVGASKSVGSDGSVNVVA